MSDQNNTNRERIVVGDFYLAPESESASRAAAVLSSKGSEDVSSILGVITLPMAKVSTVQEKDYLPSKASEWIIQADLLSPSELAASAVATSFGKEWREKYGGLTIYGKDARTGHWTFLISADGPKSVTALQFAWHYYESWSEDPEITSMAMYAGRLDAVTVQMRTLAKANVHAEVVPDAAQERSKQLSVLSERFNREIVLCLRAPSGRAFAGKDVWDVMLCLGLKWGDMDCFHWLNRSDSGGDFFFSVSTSTPPGYFLPEEIAANRVAVRDLMFGYSLPRSPDPVTVFERMLAAVHYAQKRLGGTVTSVEGGASSPGVTLQQIRAAVKELNALGFPPGSSEALRFF